MRTIACLHVAYSSIELFETALSSAEIPDGVGPVMLHHVVRPELLADVDLDGTAREVLNLSSLADAVLVTCSTVGSAAEMVAPVISVPVARADRALATAAVEAADPGDVISVLYAAPSTAESTRTLFTEATVGSGVGFNLVHVEDAWERFGAGELDAYLDRIVEVAAAQPDGQPVVLAQASMAPASARLDRLLIDVPTCSIRSILQRLAD